MAKIKCKGYKAKKRAIKRIREMTLDHLSLPRRGSDQRIKHLQDDLLPDFIEAARLA
jgi:hypothetical protein